MREELVGRALTSYREMKTVLHLLTREEIERTLQLERASMRRTEVINELIRRATKLYSNHLKGLK